MSLKIRNAATGESIDLARDVCHEHPAWVHEQCDTTHESDLQIMLDQGDLIEYMRHADEPDECGIYWTGGAWEIESEDGEPEDYDDSGRLWTVGNRTLKCDGHTVAKWSRCVVSYYGRDGEWTTEEDPNGGDSLPDEIDALLTRVGLSDDLPAGADEPDAPSEDEDGEWVIET
jgi:hypothetical protein